ncbi:hypothetical protein [Lewinella cohaerens]|uniref:hypothetical protein n=1 Tax=Lewinella cohaerens TaxID=70995 RepID=UPI000363E9AC|nr:hypothetical protein [Lewinella cohaerens]
MRLFSLLLLLSGFLNGMAQDIPLQLRFAKSVEKDVVQRLTPALQRNGALLDSLSGVLLEADLVLAREGQIEGMRTRFVAAYDLLVNLRLSGSDQVISTASTSLQATGSSLADARRNALRQLTNGGTSANRLWETLKADYQKTFTANCNDLLATAAQQAERGNLLTALAITDAIPMASPCYAQARNKRQAYYLDYQAASCRQHLDMAHQQLALEMPKAALDEIGKIDPSSDCGGEARQLVEKAAAQLKDQQSRKAQFLRQVYQNQVQIEQARNTIISDLVKE